MKAMKRPFTCHRCGAAAIDIEVSESQQMRQASNGKRLHADVRCSKCKHQWWSRHPDALRLSRIMDARAKGGTDVRVP